MPEPIVQDEQIHQLTPSLFTAGGPSGEVDADVREKFFRLYKPLRDGGLEPYHLFRVATAIYYYRPILARMLAPTRSKHVVEIGCGHGWKALAWADQFASYTGIELLADHAAEAENYLKQFGDTNARVIVGNVTDILTDPTGHGIESIDLLVLYAVIEHLTIPERREIIQLARDVYNRGGAVLIAESPNRLCRMDLHSWHLPFVEWLPPELLAEYAPRSPRAELASELAAAPPDRRLVTLDRIGRGVSYHDFECFWDTEPVGALSLLNDGYSLELLNLNPPMREETDLLTFREDNAFAFPRLFTRYWLEGLFQRTAGGTPGRDVNYVPPAEMTTAPVRPRRRFWELDEITVRPGPDQSLTFPAAASDRTQVVLIDIQRSRGELAIEADSGQVVTTIDLGPPARGRLPSSNPLISLPLPSSARAGGRLRVGGNDGEFVCQGVLYV